MKVFDRANHIPIPYLRKLGEEMVALTAFGKNPAATSRFCEIVDLVLVHLVPDTQEYKDFQEAYFNQNMSPENCFNPTNGRFSGPVKLVTPPRTYQI